jgi:lipopolysaccharide transport system ATP-binding protein
MALVLAGELVTLRIELLAEQAVANAVTGFYVKNRLGQLMFGDNTAMSSEDDFSLAPDEHFLASFQFVMPRLLAGDYFIAIGVSEGTQDQHVVQHWLHEALRFSAIGGSMAAGLIGIPMLDIRLERITDDV